MDGGAYKVGNGVHSNSCGDEMLLSWPSRLPRPTFDGYALEPQGAVTRTDMDAGPARQRRRFTDAPTRIPVRWRMSQTDFATFEAWFRLKLDEGALDIVLDSDPAALQGTIDTLHSTLHRDLW